MKIHFWVILLFSLCFLLPFASAATIKGSLYNEQLVLAKDVFVEINTTPAQKFLAKQGSYEFIVPSGEYTLIARKGLTEIKENTKIVDDGTYIVDLFLLPDFSVEDELWQNADELIVEESILEKDSSGAEWWRYLLVIVILGVLGWRYARMRRKYGSLTRFRREMKVEHAKTVEQHKEEIAQEPGYLDEVLAIIRNHDGRITQKQLRNEMLHLSEAKISLILTELQHKGVVEKIKKGRGNVIVLKK
ncbi:hypothetical protein HYT55_00190 [Candidatus Woesearchaeota archaeon]|nr:hypothetical protein [Candidatus Woesearchaeota archaeon]